MIPIIFGFFLTLVAYLLALKFIIGLSILYFGTLLLLVHLFRSM
jgi:hypothetical protein